MSATELMALAERVEAEPASGKLWREAFAAIHPEPAPRLVNARFTSAWMEWNSRQAGFTGALLNDCYRDAAAMLMPEGWRFSMTDISMDGTPWWLATATTRNDASETPPTIRGLAEGPHAEARARLAAALRAHAQEPPTTRRSPSPLIRRSNGGTRDRLRNTSRTAIRLAPPSSRCSARPHDARARAGCEDRRG